MRNKKRLITAVLALCTFTGSMVMPVYAAETTDLQLIINDTLYVASDEQVSTQLIEGRTYVPISFLGAALDYRVQWLRQSRKVCIFTDESTPFYAEDAFPSVAEDTTIQILIDGEVLEIAPTYGVPFLHEKGRAMVPLSVVAAKLNCDVAWQDGVVLVTEIPKAVSEPSDNRDNQVADVTDRNQGTDSNRADSITAANTNSSDTDKSNHDELTDTVPWYYSISIQGESVATAEQLEAYLYSKTDYVQNMMAKRYPDRVFIGYPENIAELYIEIGKKYNIRGDLAFAQAVKETGFFQFYGIVQRDQNNFCGLGATGVVNDGDELQNGVNPERAVYLPGVHGITFGTVADGVEAHIQHLYAYAAADELPDGCELVDPRFKYINRGIAPLWTGLNGRWAVPGNGYGESIISDYWMDALDVNGIAIDDLEEIMMH
ncbi:MAG: glucosaminidase domain-containing protein [Peptococcaceae bacterium]|nr:glucosaminidase domain-containing protein [Peptococcaceae bacterium]